MNENDELEVMDQQGNRLKITRGEYARQTMAAARQYWENIDAMRHFTVQFLQEGFPAQSLEVAERAAELSNGNVRDLYMRAVALTENGRLDEAATAFDELREDAAYPADVARAIAGLARVRARQGRTEEVEPLLHEAIDTDPDSPSPMVELFGFKSSQQQPQSAIDKIRSVAEKYQRSAGPHRAMAHIALSQGDKKTIGQAIRNALSRATDQEKGELLAEATMLLGQSGQPQEIIALLEPERAQLNHPFALMNLAMAYAETGRKDDARALLTQLRDGAPPQLKPAIEARLQDLG